jgi:uncharacterized membrane protein YhaH (DUF805 family)
VQTAVVLPAYVLIAENEIEGSATILYLSFAVIVAIYIPTIALYVRRLHDIGLSGLWLIPEVLLTALTFLSVVPGELGQTIFELTESFPFLIISGLSSLVFLVICLIPSQPDANRFGPNPHGPAVSAADVFD